MDMAENPRLRVNPRLREAVRASGRPGWQLAYACGFIHHSRFSALIHAKTIPATALNRERLQRIASEIGFPAEQLFIDRGAR